MCKTAEMFHVEHIPFQNILQMGKIKERVTERLDTQETAKAINTSIDRITNILNNPLFSSIYGINEAVGFTTATIQNDCLTDL